MWKNFGPSWKRESVKMRSVQNMDSKEGGGGEAWKGRLPNAIYLLGTGGR
jgi:hypothetical protein